MPSSNSEQDVSGTENNAQNVSVQSERGEPTTGDVIQNATDAILSNRFVDDIRRKSRSQAFYEFFNRTLGTGALLLIIGVVGLVVTLTVADSNLGVYELTDTRILVAVLVILWLVLEAIRTVNDGTSPFARTEEPYLIFEAARFGVGLLFVGTVVYTIYIQNSNTLDAIGLTFIAALFVGLWFIGISWMMGGLLGIYRNLNSN